MSAPNGSLSSSGFSIDTLPPALERRTSFDFTHQDSLTLLDPKLAKRQTLGQSQAGQGTGVPAANLAPTLAGGIYTSPGIGPTTSGGRPLYHATASFGPPTLTLSEDEKHPIREDDDDEDEDDGGDKFTPTRSRSLAHHLPRSRLHPSLDPLRRAATVGSIVTGGGSMSTNSPSEYRALAAGLNSLHFDDLLREKSSVDLDTVATGAGIPTCRITVTGELIENKALCDPLPSARRRNSNLGTKGEEDNMIGSVKVFTNLEEFLNDEESRRQKYDEAAAAHQACMENVAAAAAVASPSAAAAAASSASTSAEPVAPLASHNNNVHSSNESTSPHSEPNSPHGSKPLAQTPLWISVEDGNDEVTELIGRYFGLHPLTIEDCQSRGIREKLEVFPEYLFLVFHALEHSSHHYPHHSHLSSSNLTQQTTDVMKTTPLKLVIFPSLVLSFHKGGLEAVGSVRKQLDKLYRNRVLNTAWLIHGLLDVVSDSLMPVVDRASKEADDMEDLIYIINPGRESHKDVLKRMGFIARRLTFLRQRLWSKRDILTSLIERDWQFFLTGVKVPYLRDIYDHLVIMLHKLDSAIEVIVTLQSTYLAVVSIDVAAVANDGNKSMKTLSAAATILLPLSLIASLMGMNVVVPFDSGVKKRITFGDLLPFSTICLSMVVISFYLYRHFKKHQYL